jgi:hypothetical protein
VALVPEYEGIDLGLDLGEAVRGGDETVLPLITRSPEMPRSSLVEEKLLDPSF